MRYAPTAVKHHQLRVAFIRLRPVIGFKMLAPDNITELRRFMGMVNQLRKFSLNIAQIARPLCELLSTKSSSWIWGPAQEEAFLSLKTELSRPTVLSFYDGFIYWGILTMHDFVFFLLGVKD